MHNGHYFVVVSIVKPIVSIVVKPRLRVRISTTPSCFAIHPFNIEGEVAMTQQMPTSPSMLKGWIAKQDGVVEIL